jgi:hypothetical protein
MLENVKMITEKQEQVLSYYSQPGVMSSTGAYTSLIGALPGEVAELVRILQGAALHVFWAERYGVMLSEERKAEVQIRPVVPKLARLFALDSRSLEQPRLPELRLVCNCRDFSLLLAAMLIAKGVPARARCGFGTYFMPGHYEDHWMTEYWQPDSIDSSSGRWVQVDAQLDELQREVLHIPFDTLDMPAGQFVLAGAAWEMCRASKANPDDFGIFEWHGMDFIKGNVLRDFLALNKVEVLPWDFWGLAQVSVSDFTSDQMALIDQIAALSLAGNDAFEQVRAVYEGNPILHIPADWTA